VAPRSWPATTPSTAPGTRPAGPNGTRWYLYYSAGTAACCEGQRSFVLESAGNDPLSFSASSGNTPDYKLGMLTLTGSDPLAAGSWTKKSTAIFQRSDANSVYGPGHCSFFTSPDGAESWLAYHANETTAQGGGATAPPGSRR